MKVNKRRLITLMLAVVVVIGVLAGPAAVSAAARLSGEPEVQIPGRLADEEKLVCYPGSWEGEGITFSYEWLSNGNPIATGDVYVIKPEVNGTTITCFVTATSSEYVGEAESSNSVVIPGSVGTKPRNTAPPEVSGEAALGKKLTCTTGTWTGSPTPTYKYAWLREGAAIEAATSSTHTVVEADEGRSLSCKVTASNNAGSESELSKNSVSIPGVKPANKGGEAAPKVLGAASPVVGETLTCSVGEWSGEPAPAYTYRWLREGTIEVSTARTYTVVEADETHSLSCEVKASNSAGSASATSKSVDVRGSAPISAQAPAVSGTAAVGDTLTCSPGEWKGQPPPAFAYQWLLDGSSIALATTNTYKVVEADEAHSISCEVTATNSEGSGKASSKSVAVGGKPPLNTRPPEVSGTAAAGDTLTCSTGTWNGVPTPTFAYQWLREGVVIAAASADAYTVAEADETHSVSCRVTATNSEGSAQASSASVKIAGSKPENATLPEVSGTPTVGDKLTCSSGEWRGQPAPTFSYQWSRDATAIASATSTTYTVTVEDEGQTLACEVTAVNSEGQGSASSKGITVSGGKPENTSPPEVSGTPAVGDTLTCNRGTWNGVPTPTYSYQWLREGAAITSATASTYTVTEADDAYSVSCRVTATNAQGKAEAPSSNSLRVPGTAPANTKAPELSGTPAVGDTLTCSQGSWSGAPTPIYSFKWLREGTPITSATKSTYTVAEADGGHFLSCAVTAINSEGEATAISKSLHVPGSPPENTKAPEVTGTAAVGDTLTCSPGKWSGTPAPSYTYKWLGVALESTASTYTVVEKDETHSLSCEVKATNSEGSAVASSSNSVKVPGSAPVNTKAPEISGTPKVGETLTCSSGEWKGVPSPTFTYQWLRDGAAIALATTSTYTAAEADEGDTLSCEVTATNSVNKSAQTSEAVVVPSSNGGIKPEDTKAPEVTGKPALGDTLTCVLGTWIGTPTPTLTDQWLLEGSPIAAATKTGYTVVEADEGRVLSCRVIATNAEGSAAQDSNAVKVPGLKPENRSVPAISAAASPPAVGETLTCSSGEWKGEPSPTFTYQWLREGTAIALATSSSYVVQSEDAAHSLTCKVTASNIEGTLSASSKPLHIAGSGPRNTNAPEVSGTAAVGDVLSCSEGTWTGAPTPKLAIQWLREGVAITSATGNTYTVAEADDGHSLSCRVTATNSEGTASQNSSNADKVSGLKPEDQVAPTVSGSPVVSETLTCSPGTWKGEPVPSFTYEWLLEAKVVGSGSSYVVQNEDVGRSLLCKVTASNGEGPAVSASSAAVEIAGSGPQNTTPPQVSGTAQVGDVLSCSKGTWTGAPTPTFAYEWLREGVMIGSATASTYTVVEADETHSLSCSVTATNSEGAATQESSDALKVPGAKPQKRTAPTVSGTPVIGETLSCSPGEWTGNPKPTYTYEWLRSGSPTSIASGNSYVVHSEDAGHSLTCTVTATNSEGKESASSKSVSVLGSPPENTQAPEVSGSPAVGGTLSCSQGGWNAAPAPTFTYEWMRDGVAIASATASSYTVAEADEGRSLYCRVTAKNSEGTNTAESDSVEIAGALPEPVTAPEVSGAPVVGETLTCSPGGWKGEPAPKFTYTWLRGDEEIASGISYVVVGADEGEALTCKVTAQNSAGGRSAVSASIGIPGRSPEHTEAPKVNGPEGPGRPAIEETLSCTPGKWTGAPTPTLTYQWLRENVAIESATTDTYTITEHDVGWSLSCKITATNSAGEETATSAPVHVPGELPVEVEEEAPKVLGQPEVDEVLKCSPGRWEGTPPPAFTYQWLLDGNDISSATTNTYVAESADLNQSISCVVTATNDEGSAAAASSNSPVITPRVVRKLETAPPPPTGSKPAPDKPKQPTAAQVLAALSSQLIAAQHRARIATVLKSAGLAFSFLAPTSGTLELFWYEVPKGAHISAKRKPVLVAQAKASFAAATSSTVKLRLTSAGRKLIRRSKKITLTAKGIFTAPGSSPVTWLKTFVLSR